MLTLPSLTSGLGWGTYCRLQKFEILTEEIMIDSMTTMTDEIGQIERIQFFVQESSLSKFKGQILVK
jgi:hypothetical protein